MDETTARALLEGERERLSRAQRLLREEHLEAEPEEDSFAELSPIDQHQADVASEVFEREKEFSLVERVEADLAEVGDALGRLDRDEYGRCESCGVPIGDQRLAAVPATRFCEDHQSYWEGVRLTLAAPGGPAPGERGESLDELVELAAVLNLDLLPPDDELDEEIEVGPEEAALHLSQGGRRGDRPMTPEEIEQAEARYAEEQTAPRPPGEG